MTPEEIQKLNPGRELDELVFKFVLGGRIPKPPYRVNFMKFSTDISAAWEVESKLIELNLSVSYSEYLRALIKLDRGYDDLFKMIHATPEQRCKAALLAVLGEEQE